MIRLGRINVYKSSSRAFSQALKPSKPLDIIGNINANRKNHSETFPIDKLMNKYDSKKEYIKSNSEKPSMNRFANMFEKSGESKNKKNVGTKQNHNSKNRSKNQKHKKHDNSKQGRKAVRFQFDTGSEQAQNAIKSIVMKIYEFNKSYSVKYVNPETNKLETKHLVEIVNNLDLSKDGIFVIAPSKEGEAPLVKLNKVHEMIKSFVDELASKKEQELLERGSIAAQKAIRQRDRAEKKKSSTKIVTLSWNISISDLNAQKRQEIARKIEKGEKFILYIGDKRSLYSARKTVDKQGGIIESLKENSKEIGSIEFNEEEELDIEMRRRKMIYEQIQVILNELECNFDTSGNMNSRVMISCSPSQKKVNAEDDTEVTSDLSSKELKRQKKMDKKKENSQLKKKKVEEEYLDSLYSFKIED